MNLVFVHGKEIVKHVTVSEAAVNIRELQAWLACLQLNRGIHCSVVANHALLLALCTIS